MIRSLFSTLSVTGLVCAACVSSPVDLEEPAAVDVIQQPETDPPIGLSQTGIDYGPWPSDKPSDGGSNTPEEIFKKSITHIFEASGNTELVRGLQSDSFQCQFTPVAASESASWTCRASAYKYSPADSRIAWTWIVEFSGGNVAASHFKEVAFIHMTIEPR